MGEGDGRMSTLTQESAASLLRRVCTPDPSDLTPLDWRTAQVLLHGILGSAPPDIHPDILGVLAYAMAHVPPHGCLHSGRIKPHPPHHCLVFMGPSEDADCLRVRHVLEQYNVTQGQLQGVVLKGAYFLTHDPRGSDVLQRELMRVLTPARTAECLRWIQAHPPTTPPANETFPPLLRMIQPTLVRFHRDFLQTREEVEVWPTPALPLLSVVGRPRVKTGVAAGGDIMSYRIAPAFPTPPCVDDVFQIVRSLGIPCAGFQTHRAPEAVSPTSARYVFQPLGRTTRCPLCEVVHKSCHNNHPYITWTKKALTLRCFDPLAKSAGWYQLL